MSELSPRDEFERALGEGRARFSAETIKAIRDALPFPSSAPQPRTLGNNWLPDADMFRERNGLLPTAASSAPSSSGTDLRALSDARSALLAVYTILRPWVDGGVTYQEWDRAMELVETEREKAKRAVLTSSADTSKEKP
jgi:hypothetical protein